MNLDGPSLYWPPLMRVVEQNGLVPPVVGSRVTWVEYIAASEELIANSNDPFVGLEVGRRMSIGTHGLLGHAALSCATLAESLDLIVRFPPFHEQGGRAKLNVEGGLAVLEYEPPVVLAGAPRFFSDMFFAAMVQSAQELAGQRPPGLRFDLDLETSTAQGGQVDERFERWIGPTVRTRLRRDRLCVPVAVLSNKIASGSASVAQLHKRLCERLLQESLSGRGTADMVRRRLVADGAPYPTLATVGYSIGLHERTLRRRLKAEGTSYQRLLDEVRCHIASEYLASSSMPTTAIARALGFSDHANFARAFQRWTGTTPSGFRAASGQAPETPTGPS